MDKVYSVTQINTYLEQIFAGDSTLRHISISGEVSNCTYHSKGHIYFTIKDAGSQLSCVMYVSKRAGLSFQLQEGLQVVVTGSICVYKVQGKYQLLADRIEQLGKGALYEQFELLKRKLAAEGLFDEAHKKPIPPYIRTLGVITASTGAAIHDIINITSRRNPYVQIILYPSKVQGLGAADELITGLRVMEDKVRPDVIIIGRGGGSIEDLFEFNDERLARAIYACSIPVISAVGHEVDFTISDFVADLRAPTPSAAAELAVFNYNDFAAALVDYHSELLSAMLHKLSMQRLKASAARAELEKLSPSSKLNSYRLRLVNDESALYNSFSNCLRTNRHRLALLSGRLDAASPLKKLSDGYSYVTDASGRNLRSIEGIAAGDRLNIQMLNGCIGAVVETIEDGGITHDHK